MIMMHFVTVNNHHICPFLCIDIDHQHVSEHGHTRFGTGSYRQVHMEEPGLLLQINKPQTDRCISFTCNLVCHMPIT